MHNQQPMCAQCTHTDQVYAAAAEQAEAVFKAAQLAAIDESVIWKTVYKIADHTFQIAFGPINKHYELSNIENKIERETAERVANWEHKCDLREAKQQCQKKKQLATELYRNKRQLRSRLWTQYLDGNEQAIEELRTQGMP